jgi:cyclin-dependent kinase 12/13
MEHDLLGLLKEKTQLIQAQIKCVLKQILEGVKHLHDHNIIHRDIKCANILVSNKGEIKLADFGLARFMHRKDKNYTNKVVTLWYRSPELLLGSTNYTVAVDMWSVGCCFAELLKFVPLFQADSEPKAIDMIFRKCGTPTDKTWPGFNTLPYYRSFAPKETYTKSLLNEFKNNSR